jgi:hypothetical protein
LVVPRGHKHLLNREPLCLSPLVSPYKVREATYKAVFAALTMAIIKQLFKNPGRIGILAFMAAIMIIEDGLLFLFGKDANNGSLHEILR